MLIILILGRAESAAEVMYCSMIDGRRIGHYFFQIWWAGYVTSVGEIRKSYKIVESIKVREHLSRTRRKWDNDINIYFKDAEWEEVD
jgi:hypothetical protein